MTDSLKKIAIVCVLLTAWAASGYTQNIVIKNGEKIVFLGDSITAIGADSPAGYARQVIRGLEANGIKASMVGAGVGGNKSDQMLARMDTDVVAQHPDWMTLSCGVNDVWFDLPLDQYRQNITKIVEKAQAENIKVVIMTATGIYEDPAGSKNQEMLPYNAFLRQLAREKNCLLADPNADLQAAVIAAGGGAQSKLGNVMTSDGIHPNALGNQVVALSLLKALGLDAVQLQKARNAWLDLPHLCDVELQGSLTLRQYEELDALGAKQNRPTPEIIGDLVSKSLDEAASLPVKAVGAPAPVVIEKADWHGYQKQVFNIDGCAAYVVVPEKTLPGNPWVWRTSFPDFQPVVDLELIKRGYHIGYIEILGLLGCDKALDLMDEFYAQATTQWGLAPKPALEPCSRGGLPAYRYAARHPDRIACIYGDAPVMDFKSWPLGYPDAKKSDWAGLLKDYGFKSDAEAMAYPFNPIDQLAPIAKARIPIRHVICLNDRIVPPEQNTLEAKRRLEKMGWTLEAVSVKESNDCDGHHFPYPDVPGSVRFIMKNTGAPLDDQK